MGHFCVEINRAGAAGPHRHQSQDDLLKSRTDASQVDSGHHYLRLNRPWGDSDTSRPCVCSLALITVSEDLAPL